MKKIKRLFQRDKYGIARGGLGLSLLLLLSMSLLLWENRMYEAAFEKERASDAARRVAVQFEQLVDNAFDQMRATVGLMDSEAAPEAALLENLQAYGPFADVGVIFEGALRRPDGSLSSIRESVSYIHYDATNRTAKVIAQADGGIQLRVSLKERGELAAWIDPESVEAVLESGFPGEYGYAVYNSATGAYLINHTLFSNDSYYDALLALNEHGGTETLLSAGSAETRISSAKDGDYYIAQRKTEISPWSVALVVPEALVASDALTAWMPSIATIVGAALLLMVLGGYTLFALHRIRVANRNAERALEVGERALNTAATEARATVFVYHRGQDFQTPCYDGLGLIGGKADGSKLATLKEIEAACRLPEEEAEQLRDRMRELTAGATAELTLRSLAQDREEHLLRFVLSVPTDDADTIIISIRDCTFQMLSQNQAEEERSYRRSVEARTESIWQVNISRNVCMLLRARRETPGAEGLQKNIWQDYSAELSGAVRDYIYPADYEAFSDSVSVAGITALYRSGKMQFTIDYRVRSGGEDYVWHRMTMRICINPETGDILANLYVFNVDAEKNAELERGERKRILHQTLTALGSIYYALYYVDLERDLCYAAKAHGGELVTQLCSPYKATFDAYIDRVVHPEDREALRTMLSAYKLHKSMTEGSHYQRQEYRRRTDDGYGWAEMIVQPARFENGVVREVVLALSNIDERGKN